MIMWRDSWAVLVMLCDERRVASGGWDGRTAQRTDTVERVTGRPARTFEAWCRAHSAAFQ